jgi:(2Fe-2S) ferredoxin
MIQSHLFICTNDRGEGKASCAQAGSLALRDAVKAGCKAIPHAPGTLRVNQSGCLGQCEKGIAAVLYPEGTWFLEQKPEDAPSIVHAVAKQAGLVS